MTAVTADPLEVWASPGGGGEACTEAEPCALGTALARLRAMTADMQGDLRVVLGDGTYALDAPIELCEDGLARDSGTNGHAVVIEAAPGARPILSGGRRIGGWEPTPGRPGVFQASAPGLRTRQLYVNGVRATRARSALDLPLYAKSESGFVRRDTEMLSWPSVSGVEVVGRNQWRTFRCPVASAMPTDQGSGTALALAEPCWTNSQGGPGEAPFDSVAWIENAFELLDEPGEWFLDEAAGTLYYAPRAGESLESAEVVAPVLEVLLRASGGMDEAGAPVYLHDLVLRGLGFRDATWLGPAGKDGYAEYQAGFHRVGDNRLARTPAAVALVRARHVRIERCTFERLGAAGLSIEAGSKDVAVVGNVFSDLSSTAIEAGDVDFAGAPGDLWRTEDVAVSNNVVDHAAGEYEGAVGIFFGYGERGRIEHNEVAHLPYTGISMGWGWADDPVTYASDNRIVGNHVHDVMTVHRDGGGIYTLGAQPGSLVAENLLERVETNALYHDEGTSGFTTTRNVMEGYTYWLSLSPTMARDNVVSENYAVTDSAYCFGAATASSGCNLAGNVVQGNVFGSPWPDAALAVRDAAGL